MDTETECATLDEALCHLHELVLSEMEDPLPGGPRFERYGGAVEADRTARDAAVFESLVHSRQR
jgi:hypothetical protein